MNVAYGDVNYPSNGPLPVHVDVCTDSATTYINITYDKQISYNNTEISGFYYCCQGSDCDSNNAIAWPEFGKELVSHPADSVIRITITDDVCGDHLSQPLVAYLWRNCPVTGYLAAPIYSVDEYRLPAAPGLG